MVVDPHEGIASYFMEDGATFEVRPFNEDVPERHADIPKYRGTGMRLVLDWSRIEQLHRDEQYGMGQQLRRAADKFGSRLQWFPKTLCASSKP